MILIFFAPEKISNQTKIEASNWHYEAIKSNLKCDQSCLMTWSKILFQFESQIFTKPTFVLIGTKILFEKIRGHPRAFFEIKIWFRENKWRSIMRPILTDLKTFLQKIKNFSPKKWFTIRKKIFLKKNFSSNFEKIMILRAYIVADNPVDLKCLPKTKSKNFTEKICIRFGEKHFSEKILN